MRVLDDTDTWLLESRVQTGKKAKIGGMKPSGSKLPKTNINMPGTSSILSGCGKNKKSTYRLCKVYKFSRWRYFGEGNSLKSE